jgi:hypothetical protein
MIVNDAQRVSEVRRQLEEAGVQYCFATYVDVHGVPKAKTIPIASFEKMCKGSELFTVGAMEGMGLIGPEKDECATVPDLDSLMILPWDKRFAWFASDLWYHDAPYKNCSRVILKKSAGEAKQARLRHESRGRDRILCAAQGRERSFTAARASLHRDVPRLRRQPDGPVDQLSRSHRRSDE